MSSKPPGVVTAVGCPYPPGRYQLTISSTDIIHSAIGSFPCTVFFIMSQATLTTTTPPVTFVYSSASTKTTTVTMAPTSLGQTAALYQHDVLPSPLILRDTIRGLVGLATVLQQHPQSQMPSQAYANYAMGPPKVSFLFQS